MPYLIDGNNVLGSWGGPVKGDDRRGDVVRRVAAFCRGRKARAVIVFDGHPLRAHEWNALERKVAETREQVAGSDKPEREDDVEGWLRRFGGE